MGAGAKPAPGGKGEKNGKNTLYHEERRIQS